MQGKHSHRERARESCETRGGLGTHGDSTRILSQGGHVLRSRGVAAENHGEAGKAAIDYLVERREVDANKIGVWGNSMGSYWAPLIAIADKRVRALVTAMSCYYDKNHIFNETSPNFRLRFMWMA